jgi:hypothetical protein
MDIFYVIVLTIAVILLILLLTYIGLQMKVSVKSKIYPPTQATCPDYWTINSDGTCQPPTTGNRNTITDKRSSPYANHTPGYKTTTGSIDFTDAGYYVYGGAKNSICGQKNWANTYGVVWDGVTNYNAC